MHVTRFSFCFYFWKIWFSFERICKKHCRINSILSNSQIFRSKRTTRNEMHDIRKQLNDYHIIITRIWNFVIRFFCLTMLRSMRLFKLWFRTSQFLCNLRNLLFIDSHVWFHYFYIRFILQNLFHAWLKSSLKYQTRDSWRRYSC